MLASEILLDRLQYATRAIALRYLLSPLFSS